MSNVPDNLKYTKDHEWIAQVSSSLVRIGITDYAQSALGDIVYIQLPKTGQVVQADKVCGEVESTKSVSEIFSPVSGTVTKINDQLDTAPEIINQDPYGNGWIAEIEISSDAMSSSHLLSSTDYQSLLQ
jgi:glycine cleavage system H protein